MSNYMLQLIEAQKSFRKFGLSVQAVRRYVKDFGLPVRIVEIHDSVDVILEGEVSPEHVARIKELLK